MNDPAGNRWVASFFALRIARSLNNCSIRCLMKEDRYHFSLADLDAATALVRHSLSETPQYEWPLLGERCGCRLWVKHENHLPIGAFKLRGGIVYLHDLRLRQPEVRGVIAATRGNHGQSIALGSIAVGDVNDDRNALWKQPGKKRRDARTRRRVDRAWG